MAVCVLLLGAKQYAYYYSMRIINSMPIIKCKCVFLGVICVFLV